MRARGLRVFGLGCLLAPVVACSGGAAREALDEAQLEIAAARPQLESSAPEELAALRATVKEAHGYLDAGQATDALALALGLPQRTREALARAQFRRQALEEEWTELATLVPPLLDAVDARVAALDGARSLPAGLTAEGLAALRRDVADQRAAWSRAVGARQSARLVGAAAEARAVEARAQAAAVRLGLRPLAAGPAPASPAPVRPRPAAPAVARPTPAATPAPTPEALSSGLPMEPNDPESPADGSSPSERPDEPPPGDLRVLESDWRALEWMIEHVEADSLVYLDTRTGEIVEPVRPQTLPPLGDDRHLRIEPLRPSEETAWMQEFVGQLADDWPRDALIEALLLSEAPRRAFAEVLGRYPGERMLWLACRRQRLRERVRSWLAGHGLAIREDQVEA